MAIWPISSHWNVSSSDVCMQLPWLHSWKSLPSLFSFSPFWRLGQRSYADQPTWTQQTREYQKYQWEWLIRNSPGTTHGAESLSRPESPVYPGILNDIDTLRHILCSLRQNLCRIKWTILKCQFSSIQYTHTIPPYSCLLQFPGNNESAFYLLAICISILHISYKWNYILHDLLCLTFSNKCVLEVHSHYGMYHYCILFYDSICVCVCVPHFVYSFVC